VAHTLVSGESHSMPFIVTSRDRRMNTSTGSRRIHRCLRTALPALVLLATAACSSMPAPVTQLQSAREAIATAERADAASMAAVELAEARTKLTAAQQAVSGKEMVAAARLADESRAAAELASARTGAAKAHAVNADIEKSTATLIEEMNRNTGATK
jgi:hypothetical protein